MRDRPLAVIILEADSVEDAKKALDSLPLVREKIIDFDIMALAPYPGFATVVQRSVAGLFRFIQSTFLFSAARVTISSILFCRVSGLFASFT